MKANYNFTAREVLNEVLELARNRPDFVYLDQPDTIRDDVGFASCSYIGAAGQRGREVGEGCIVGQALQNLGVSTAALSLMEGQGAAFVVQRLACAHDEESLDRLRHIQAHQDGGMPWGMATAKAMAK